MLVNAQGLAFVGRRIDMRGQLTRVTMQDRMLINADRTENRHRESPGSSLF